MTHERKRKAISTVRVRRAGRPRLFDPSAALAAAERTFLLKGYSATTVDDLSAAMGINKPSLYAAFDSKEVLYQKALAAYGERMAGLFEAALAEPRFEKALLNLYSVALDAYVSDDGDAVGCMVACTAVTESALPGDIRLQTKSIMDEIDSLVARRIELAKTAGEIPASLNAKALSRLAVGVLHSLAMRTRAGTSRKILNEMAADAVAMLLSR